MQWNSFTLNKVPFSVNGTYERSRMEAIFSQEFKVKNYSIIPKLRQQYIRSFDPVTLASEKKRQELFLQAISWVDNQVSKKIGPTPQNVGVLYSIINGFPLEFRNKEVFIKDATGQILDDCPSASALPKIMEDFWKWREVNTGTLLNALGSHFLLACIHPYLDGNGRLSRLLEYWDLRQLNPTQTFPCSEVLVYWQYDLYREVFKICKKEKAIDPFLDLMLEFYSQKIHYPS